MKTIKEFNGQDSHIIRLSTEECIKIGLMAISKHLDVTKQPAE